MGPEVLSHWMRAQHGEVKRRCLLLERAARPFHVSRSCGMVTIYNRVNNTMITMPVGPNSQVLGPNSRLAKYIEPWMIKLLKAAMQVMLEGALELFVKL